MRRLLCLVASSLALAGCVSTAQENGVEPTISITSAKDPNDDLGLGKQHFRESNYGLAELHFRRATEVNPGNVEAWLGLAASYDHLRRFDMADRAYDKAIQLSGEKPEILNNRGFSYLMRGDRKRARRDLEAAYAKDPDNPKIIANLRALREAR